MSSLAFPREATTRRRPRRDLSALVQWLGADMLLVVPMLALAAALLAFLPSEFDVDSWLALVAGRAVSQGGIPHHELLTVVAHGTPWVDQQWLSQLTSYRLYEVGGLGFYGLVNVILFTAAVAGSTAAARRLGAPFRSVLLFLPLGLLMMVFFREVRTQEFAMPLFVILGYLLARDSRTASRSIYWCLPILVLWANLHGTVTLGAMLVVLRGATVAWERRRRLLHSVRQWKRPLALIVGAPAAILITPYGSGIVGYYHTTILAGTLRQHVSEWLPITSAPIAAGVFFIAAGLLVWSFGSGPSRTTTWEKLALLTLATGSISVIRNLLLFGLLAVMIAPLSLTRDHQAARPSTHPWRGRVNLALGCGALAALVITAVLTLVRPAVSLELSRQRAGVLTAVERATQSNPSLRVLTDDQFADWLLWRDPSLAGKMAYDVRFEVLTARQLATVQNVFTVTGPDYKQGARGYGLLVLAKRSDPDAVKAFMGEPGRRVLYNDGDRIVILRSPSQAS